MVNSAARRLLNAPVSLRLEQLAEFGAVFQRDIAQSRGNQRAVTRIFLPFFTTKSTGSGIGLALARQVMLMHGGAITAASCPGGGDLFRLTF